jgi:cell wall-associated NlpC family hydrolase
MHWSSRYVGLPWREKGRSWAGIDCWGLVRLVYAEALGIELPSYIESYASVSERAEIAMLLSADCERWPWRPLLPGQAEGEFDVALFMRAGIAAHVGVIVGGGRMLHVEPEHESCVMKYRDGRWASRLLGVYRHAARG